MPALVDELRADLPEGALLTGDAPLFADISALLAERLPLVIAFVVGVSVLLLAMVFRSVLVPIKAAVMNLLSIGAAYGVLTAVFQWGWGDRALRPRPGGAGVQLGPDPDLRDPVRALDGLRGVPALADPRGLARAPATPTAAWCAGCPTPAGSSPAPPRSWSPSSSASPPRWTWSSRCSASAWRSPSSWTRPWSGWCWSPRRCRCSAASTGGCRRWLDRVLPTLDVEVEWVATVAHRHRLRGGPTSAPAGPHRRRRPPPGRRLSPTRRTPGPPEPTRPRRRRTDDQHDQHAVRHPPPAAAAARPGRRARGTGGHDDDVPDAPRLPA